MKNTKDFRRRLEGAPLLLDGAMGTELYSRGVYTNQCYDELNTTRPEIVSAVHSDYLRAGAEIISTNTYGANRHKLSSHGLAETVVQINKAGAKIARSAMEKSGHDAFVAGCIGPLGRRLKPLGTLDIKDAKEAFAEQARGLVEGGVDLIIIETMAIAGELVQAVKAVHEVCDLPVIAQFTLSEWNESAYGTTLPLFAAKLHDLDVDVIGINCSIGPYKLLEASQVLLENTDHPIIIQPNAGELEWVEDRLITRSTPEYFAEYTKRLIQNGVKLVGACCGSTPAHISAMEAAIRAISPELSKVKIPVAVKIKPRDFRTDFIKPYREMSQLAKSFDDNQFVFSVELNPPRSPSIKRIIRNVKKLQENGVSIVNIPDGPRASARLSAMVLAQSIQAETGMDVLPHYTCRDRNILGIQSDLLGAEVMGINNILCITGDPPKLGDYPMATAVFDVDAIGLIHIGDNLNHSLDLAGNPIPNATALLLGCGANPGALDLDLEIDRLHRKIDNGACYVLTQPVFNEEIFFHFVEKADIPEVPILVGILPLASFRNAEFFHNEVPGMEVPQPIRDRLKPVTDREEAAKIGVEIAAETLIKSAPKAQGAYIMPPFGRVELALQVIDIFRESDYGRKILAPQE